LPACQFEEVSLVILEAYGLGGGHAFTMILESTCEKAEIEKKHKEWTVHRIKPHQTKK
jgi:hypothetical protein